MIVATVCHPSMRGCRTVICQPLDEQGREEGRPILAVDPYGAGERQRVILSTDGSATRAYVGDPKSPLRNMVVAVVDAERGRPEPMRLGHVIGRVTLSQQEPAYTGGRFLLVQPFGAAQFRGAPMTPLAKGSTVVVYDQLGAGLGQSSASPRAPRPPCRSTSRPLWTPTTPRSSTGVFYHPPA